MPTSRQALRRLLTEALGGGTFTGPLVTSSDGAAGGTTVIDTDLASYDDDYFEGWWVVLTATYAARQVTDFVGSTGTLTVAPAFSAQVLNAVNYELHRYDPTKLHLAINRATELCFPKLYIPRRDETLIVNNLLLNSDFETFAAGNFTNWTLAGAGSSVAESATILWHGADAAAITAGAGAAATYSQGVTASPANAQVYTGGGQRWYFGALVHATAASTARLQITDGTDTESSSYHTGDDGWEWLEVSILPGTNISDVTVRFQVAAGGVARIDSAYCFGPRLYRYTRPSAVQKGPFRLSIQHDLKQQNGLYLPITGWHFEEDASNPYLVLDEAYESGHRLRLEGQAPLSTVTTETGNVEVDATRAQTLVYRAAWWLMESEHHDAGVNGRNLYGEDTAKYERIYRELVGEAAMRHPKRGVRVRQSWDEG